MSKKKSTKAPSKPAADKDVGIKLRYQNTKENKTMQQIYKALFGVFYLILKVSFIVAIVALMKMPVIHFVIDIPLYQAVGSVILAFLIYLELYAYFAKPATKTGKKKDTEPATALSKFKTGFIETSTN